MATGGLAPAIAESDPEREAGEALRNGDRRLALTCLMRGYGDLVYRHCLGILRDPNRAEDALQTTFVQAWEALAEAPPPTSFRCWLLTIARNRCLDDARGRRRWARLLRPTEGTAEAADSRPACDEKLHDRTVEQRLEQCLGELNPTSRDLLLLRYRQGLGYEQIAPMLGQTTGSLRVRSCRLMTVVRRCLEKKGVWS